MRTSKENGASDVSTEARAGVRKSLRVLVADDSADFVNVLSTVLELHGHEVLTASNGSLALAEAERARPDVLVLDLRMPGLDGFEVARRIRSTDWGAGIALFALTGWVGEEDKRRVEAAGFNAHVIKGGNMDALFSLINEQRAALG